jgi:hypothetical protein
VRKLESATLRRPEDSFPPEFRTRISADLEAKVSWTLQISDDIRVKWLHYFDDAGVDGWLSVLHGRTATRIEEGLVEEGQENKSIEEGNQDERRPVR